MGPSRARRPGSPKFPVAGLQLRRLLNYPGGLKWPRFAGVLHPPVSGSGRRSPVETARLEPNCAMSPADLRYAFRALSTKIIWFPRTLGTFINLLN